MNDNQLIKIEISTTEAIMFRNFMKYHDLFLVLQKNGILDMQFGKCTLNFANGMLQNVVKEEVVYRK